MLARSISVLSTALLLLWVSDPVAAQPERYSFGLEVSNLDATGSFEGEFPVDTGLRHQGGFDAADPAFGLNVGYRFGYRFGLRLTFLQSEIGLEAASSCSPVPCTFNSGDIRFVFGDIDWSVDQDADARLWILDAPVHFPVSSRVELFGGPSLVHLTLDDVASTSRDDLNLDGLILESSPDTPSLGLHVGGNVLLDWQGRWSLGLIGRWLPTEIDFRIEQPLVAAHPNFLEATTDEDLVMLGLVLSRRFR